MFEVADFVTEEDDFSQLEGEEEDFEGEGIFGYLPRSGYG